ncbi:MAG: histidine kinase dimerization/phosphoacceptor domain -containing protein [Microscillaceae bacterium]|nr:histidine kinase dimerization/phosphoacceptor domain -containing protein [Microscillaceae bacterium]
MQSNKIVISFWAIVFIGIVGLSDLTAQNSDTDGDGIPDKQEKSSCIKPFDRYFLEKEGELVYLRSQNLIGFILKIEKTTLYEVDYLGRRQSLIDEQTAITSQFTRANKEFGEAQRTCNNPNATSKEKKDACKRVEQLSENIKQLKAQNQGIQGSLKQLNDSLETFKNIPVYKLSLRDTLSNEIITQILKITQVQSFFNKDGCLKDSDQDSYADIFDRCPDTPGSLEGCPDDSDTPTLLTQKEKDSLGKTKENLVNAARRRLSVQAKEEIIQDSIRRFNRFMEKISNQTILTAGQTDTLKIFARYFSSQTKSLNDEYSEVVASTEVALNAAELKLKDNNNFIYSIRALIIAFILVILISFLFIRRLGMEKIKLKRQIIKNVRVTQELDDERVKLQEAYLKLEVNTQKIKGDAQELKKKNTMIELLLRELNHRVKNSLLAITAMLKNELDRGNPEELRNEVKSVVYRLNEIEKLHSKLTYNEKNEEKIPIREYFEEIVESLKNLHILEHPVLIHLDIPLVEISGGKAYFMGFILYELVTNSLKHSFRNVQDPRIDIILNMPQPNRYELSIRDNGLGLHPDLFEGERFRFERVNSHGLKIIDLITDMHQGTFYISPDSSRDSEVRGAYFVCTLVID